MKQRLYLETWPHRHTIQVADSPRVRCEGRSAGALKGPQVPCVCATCPAEDQMYHTALVMTIVSL